MSRSGNSLEVLLARTDQTYPAGTVLAAINADGIRALDEVWRVDTYDKGRMILHAEDTNSDIWFLLSGIVRVAVFTEAGREVSMFTLDRGDCFGEFSAIDGAPRSASIEAVTDCIVGRLTSDAFQAILRTSPDVSMAFLRILVAKLREMTTKVSDFSAHTADERIRAELLRVVEAAANGRDAFVVEAPPTQSEIAARVFTNRETVAREMGRMRREGLIERVGRRIAVHSLERFRDYVEMSARH